MAGAACNGNDTVSAVNPVRTAAAVAAADCGGGGGGRWRYRKVREMKDLRAKSALRSSGRAPPPPLPYTRHTWQRRRRAHNVFLRRRTANPSPSLTGPVPRHDSFPPPDKDSHSLSLTCLNISLSLSIILTLSLPSPPSTPPPTRSIYYKFSPPFRSLHTIGRAVNARTHTIRSDRV